MTIWMCSVARMLHRCLSVSHVIQRGPLWQDHFVSMDCCKFEANRLSQPSSITPTLLSLINPKIMSETPGGKSSQVKRVTTALRVCRAQLPVRFLQARRMLNQYLPGGHAAAPPRYVTCTNVRTCIVYKSECTVRVCLSACGDIAVTSQLGLWTCAFADRGCQPPSAQRSRSVCRCLLASSKNIHRLH